MPREFNKSIITDKGALLLNQAQAGEALLEFTRMVIGDGTYTSEEASIEIMQKIENLKSPKQSYPIIEKSLEGDRCLKLTTVFYNAVPGNEEAVIKEGFFINEIGLFCQEKDKDETEVLYSIVTVKDGPGDYMPAYNGENRAEIIQDWYTTITNNGVAYIKYKNGTFALAETVDKLSANVDEIKKFIFDEKEEFNVSSSLIDFDDSGEVDSIESFVDFMESFVKETSIYQFLTNLKAGLKYVLHAGLLVNSGMCETPGMFALDAAYGKTLTDQIAGLYSDKVTYNIDTDSLDVYRNGVMIGALPVHFQEFDLLDTDPTDWELTNLTLTKKTGTLIFKCLSVGDYKAIYKKKINVQEGKRIYSVAGDSSVFASGNLSVCTNSKEDSSVATITYPSGTGGSKSSSLISAGEYYFIFWGYGIAGNATFTKLTIS